MDIGLIEIQSNWVVQCIEGFYRGILFCNATSSFKSL